MWFHHAIYSMSLKILDLITGESSISLSDLAWNLGVIFDKPINMNSHVTSVFVVLNHFCHRTHLLLWSMPLWHLVQIIVTLLYGIALWDRNHLKQIQNAVDHTVTNNYSKINWLLVKQHIHFNILIMTYKYISDESPKYLCDLLITKITLT